MFLQGLLDRLTILLSNSNVTGFTQPNLGPVIPFTHSHTVTVQIGTFAVRNVKCVIVTVLD